MEQVILLDEAGSAIGVADKATVHHQSTPLHLAFSCYVINTNNQVLLTRRALDKKTWPGVWTNSCCGHPAPGEPLADAVRRRLRDELSLTVCDIDLVLPTFRYQAVMPNGVIENEMCPVLRASSDADPIPDPQEVDDYRWMDWAEFIETVTSGVLDVSPWCTSQVDQLGRFRSDARRWTTAPEDQLPSAARPGR
ncbi:MAG: isopentenyl-diphosphate Delta-isomerase [Candidatus Dormibacteraceae bacterium]